VLRASPAFGNRNGTTRRDVHMTNTLLWHSDCETDCAVYLNDALCPDGGFIALQDRRSGEGRQTAASYARN
jgi:hypothetical protein